MNAKDAVTKLKQGATEEAGDGSEATPEERGRTEKRERESEPPPLDAVFELLKNQRRRHTLKYLEDRDEQVTLSDLAEHVAALENDTTTRALTSDERKRAYVGLYQCHLPKMDEMDAVDFNRDRGIIELGPNADQLKPYLELDEKEDQDPWPLYYLGAAGCGLVALLVGVAGIGGATVGLAGTATVAAFVVLALSHVRATDEA